MNELFDFLNFDFSDLAKKLEDLKVLATDKYNDFINNNVKKYDINTEEGYEAFIKDAADIRTKLLQSESAFASKYLVSALDSVVEKAMNQHSEAQAVKRLEPKEENAVGGRYTNKVNDIVKNEVNRNITENHGKVNTGVGVVKESERVNVEWPSDKINFKQKREIWKLVDEYMDTKIIPFLDQNVNENTIDDMAGGLFEFAAWILTKEE